MMWYYKLELSFSLTTWLYCTTPVASVANHLADVSF